MEHMGHEIFCLNKYKFPASLLNRDFLLGAGIRRTFDFKGEQETHGLGK